MNGNINWKYVVVFYCLALILAFPFNSFMTEDFHHRLTDGTIFYKSSFMPAGIATLIAGLLAFKFDKTFIKKVTFLGQNRIKNLIISIVPMVVFSISGLQNDLNINPNLFGFIISLTFLIYALTEEIFWRGYLINAFIPLGRFKNYLILGLLWWIWHIPFGNNLDNKLFFLMIVGGSFLIGQFVEATKSFLTTAGIHSIMNIGSNTNWTKLFLIDLTIIIVTIFIIDKAWKNDTKTTENSIIESKFN
ncbi:MAG: CPBP family intramembrane metalloprotease [Saprospiraceae bacterium]|nr:CPBP family intramembrane metalloprotease [Saprospiraceae bacterium]